MPKKTVTRPLRIYNMKSNFANLWNKKIHVYKNLY